MSDQITIDAEQRSLTGGTPTGQLTLEAAIENTRDGGEGE